MILDNNQRQELLSCVNSRIESREDLIRKIVDYFGPLKATGREWKIKIDISKFNELEISKPEYTYKKTTRWWQQTENLDVTRRKISIELYPVDKDGFRKYSESKKYHELEYRDLLELSTKLDDILINIGIQEDCKMNVGPVYRDTTESNNIKDKDKITNNES